MCPGSAAAPRTRPKRQARIPSELAGATISGLTDATNSTQAKGTRPEIGDTHGAKTVAPAAVAAANSAKTRDVHPTIVGATNRPKASDTRPAKAAGRDLAKADTKEVRIANMRLVAPKSWLRERPPLDFVLAQFSLPRAKGDPSDAQLTVAPAGVNGPEGLERLREELKETPDEGSIERLQIGGKEVVLVDSTEVEGPDDDESPPGPSPSPASETRYRILNAIVILGDQAYFVNCTGPEKTVSERAGEFRAFLQTMKPVDSR